MRVVASEEAQQYIRARGGVLYVRSRHHRCCGGGLTLLDATTTRPSDSSEFLCVASSGIDVRFRGGSGGRPGELAIELRGRTRRRPVAYWDGCAFKP